MICFIYATKDGIRYEIRAELDIIHDNDSDMIKIYLATWFPGAVLIDYRFSEPLEELSGDCVKINTIESLSEAIGAL